MSRQRLGVESNPAYNSWLEMRRRCYKANRHNYSYYGGRGIKVCDRWLNSFDNFLTDMGERPGKNYTIDRIDNDGNYEPTNCRWASKQEQAINRTRKVGKSGYKNIYVTKYGRYQVYFKRLGETITLGTFDKIREAIIARNKYYEN